MPPRFGAAPSARGDAPPNCNGQGGRLPALPGYVAATRHQPVYRSAWGGAQRSLGRHRWKVERTLAWLYNHRRLRVRDERGAESHQALLTLACALICWNFFQHGCC